MPHTTQSPVACLFVFVRVLLSFSFVNVRSRRSNPIREVFGLSRGSDIRVSGCYFNGISAPSFLDFW